MLVAESRASIGTRQKANLAAWKQNNKVWRCSKDDSHQRRAKQRGRAIRESVDLRRFPVLTERVYSCVDGQGQIWQQQEHGSLQVICTREVKINARVVDDGVLQALSQTN
jgi:hypothetical protein